MPSSPPSRWWRHCCRSRWSPRSGPSATRRPAAATAARGPRSSASPPHQGTIRGGTVVHISGGGFTAVSGVSFGGRPAQSFEVKSDNLIDAVAPAVPRGGGVRIEVAASGGASTSNAPFTFIGCHVPRVKDDRVQRARKTLAAARCETGQVKPVPSARKPLRVIAEVPRPGAWLEPGARIALRVR